VARFVSHRVGNALFPGTGTGSGQADLHSMNAAARIELPPSRNRAAGPAPAMVDMGAARMTPFTPNPAAIDPKVVARGELVEALARMVNRVIQHGKTEAQSALGSIEEIRTTLAGVVNIDDFLEDLDAAERTLRLYLTT
jgi:hypothetical protein